MTTLRRRAVLGLLPAAVFLVAGCESSVPARAVPEMSFAHLPKIALDVSRVEIVEAYRSPGRPPNVEHLFPVSPAAAAARWGRDRLAPAGDDKRVRLTVRDGAVTETALKSGGGVRALFTTEQAARYDAVLEVTVEILDTGGKQLGMVSSRAERSRTVPENLSVTEREAVWYEMTEALMTDLNASLEAQIRRHLARWVR